jgi:hypothetical protein
MFELRQWGGEIRLTRRNEPTLDGFNRKADETVKLDAGNLSLLGPGVDRPGLDVK